VTSENRRRICLIFEGTYPYVRGGVGVWAHELVTGLPDYDFSIVSLTDRARGPEDFRFKLPANVREVVTVDLGRPPSGGRLLRRFQKKRDVQEVADAFTAAFEGLQRNDFAPLEQLVLRVEKADVDENALLNNAVFWNLISRLYAALGTDDSIARFFWVWEAMARSVVRLIRTPLPEADLYHCAATGYAGLVGCLAKVRTRKPLVLSEHGLYLQERQMEVAFHDVLQGGQRRAVETFFEWISRWTYREADRITSLGDFIRHHQISLGADPARTLVVPNGIDIDRFAAAPRREHAGFRVGLVGRIAPVKDIKLLIQAAAELRPSIPDLQVALIGPVEDATYERECRDLIASLGLDSVVTFEGVKDASDCYVDLDLMVICSLKEVQPLTVLEAMAAGVPMVATRSGAIPEMLSGIGQVIPPRDLAQLVRAVRRVHDDATLRQRMSEAGRERVQRYEISQTLRQFAELYAKVGQEAAWAG
jgi:glycosyltransferase involved in cell wall biosynthesis